MPKYSVMVNRTRTIEMSVEIEVSAKDEQGAQEKVAARIDKAVAAAGKALDTFDWEESSNDDMFDYEVTEA